MKKKSFTLLVVAAICSSMMFSSCIGSFGLTNKLLSWNKSLGNKFANEAVFFLFWIFPAYEVSLFLDTIILNSIEFWSGSNPVADTGTKTIETENGIYTVETRPMDTISKRKARRKPSISSSTSRTRPGACLLTA